MNAQALRLSVVVGLVAISIGLAMLIAAPIALSDPIDAKPAAPTIMITTSNLLINPDFENGYYSYPGHNSIRVPNGWGFAWYTDTPSFGNHSPFMQPEVSVLNCVWPNCNALNYPPRINTGQHAVESGKRWANQDVSLYQSVGNVPIGALVFADAWMAAWVSSCNPNVEPFPMALSLLSDNASDCQPGAWPLDSNHMMIGIDPYGGTDPRAATVVWNWDAASPPWWGPYDYYSATVPAVAVAQAQTVTMFMRGVTVQPAKFNTVYFDTASLTYTFPLAWQIDQGPAWPLTTAITIGLQTPVSLTNVSAVLQDPIGQLAPIDYLGVTTMPSRTLSWRFVPERAGRYRFMLTAQELPDPQVQSIDVPALPFHYEQERLLLTGATTLITFGLSSPITLTDLTADVVDAQNASLSTTLVYSKFQAERYDVDWQFTAETPGVYTVTLNAAEFMDPFLQRIVAASARVCLPLVLRYF
jgi:hypothetical protein